MTASIASGRVARLGDEGRPVLELVPVAALADEGLVDEALGDDDMRHRGQHRDVGAGPQRQVMAASTCGVRTRSMRRGSTTISFAPSRSRFFMREAKTGWPSVGLAPMTRMTSACSTQSKSCVPAEVPKVVFRP